MRMPTLLIPCAIITLPAFGDLPAAMDRVPTNAAAVIGIQSLSAFQRDLSGVAELFDIEPLSESMEMAQMLLSTPGLNAEGSAALVVMPGEDGFVNMDGSEPMMFAILPVSNYDEMVGAFSGDANDVIATMSMQGEEVFATNLGGGFCAIAPDGASLAGLSDVRGKSGAHEAHLGLVGRRVIENSDMFIALDLKAFRPAIEQGFGEMRDNLDTVQMMMGEQGAGMGQMVEMMDGFQSMLVEDGQAAILGLSVDESGMSLDAGAQFREGSDFAAMAAGSGDAAGLLDHIPDMPFIFAFAMDMSNPELKAWGAKMAETVMEMNPGQAGGFGALNFGELMDLQDGSVFIMGEPMSLMMGGMFNNMLEFKPSKNGGELLKTARQMVAKMDGMTQGGITFNTSIDADVKEIAGTSVDTWSMRMTPDPEDPSAAPLQMVFPMLFGPNGGPQGYYAVVDGGIITTMARNDQLMAQAIEAANSGHGLASGSKLKEAMSHQPDGSVAQMYLDVGVLGKQVMGLMAMMGQPAPFEIPDGLAPVGMSLATGSGGLQGRIHIPMGILDMVAKLKDDMGGGADDGDGGPRF